MTMAAFFLLSLFPLCSSYGSFFFSFRFVLLFVYFCLKKGIRLENSFVAFMKKFVFVFSTLAPLDYVFIPSPPPEDVAIYTNALSDIYASLLLICFCMQNMDVQLLLSIIHCLAHFKRETCG